MKPTVPHTWSFVHRILACFFLLFLSERLVSQTSHRTTITLDPQRTQIHWTLGTTVHTVHGSFKLIRGAISCDPTNGTASGSIEIDAISGESGNSSRDQKMHKQVLESSKFNVITFRALRVEGSCVQPISGDFTVDGILTLVGRDHPLKVKGSVQPETVGSTIKARLAIPYVEWGLKDPSSFVFRVDKEVIIDLVGIATASQ